VLRRSKLPPAVRERSLAVFRRLIEAEAAAHGLSPERVHLHEAGGTDAILDVVGACFGIERLAPARIVVSPLTTGFGSVRCAHGVYPVPGPATLLLTRGVPLRAGTIEVERLTPTGAALLTTLADEWGPPPPFRPLAVGYGAGARDLGDTPNLLRLVLGEADAGEPAGPTGAADEVVVLECALDDSTPQALAYAAERLLAAGALDVYTTAVTMKKGRAGHLLTVLARPERFADLTRLLLAETTTLGLRHRVERRIELERELRRVRTPFGTVRLKLGRRDGQLLQVTPEYEDCAALAARRGVPLRVVQRAALAAHRGRGETK
ncbi:MAG TPA: nickel pincer cofactor biosynthesis protein LarC, partial [Candidatus Polarisedimenticolaceae bacterium]|nr:nickel pincer cofactor biosynthesis protein LarC [Candidatus Polarisedimenticolaceae bacterium]